MHNLYVVLIECISMFDDKSSVYKALIDVLTKNFSHRPQGFIKMFYIKDVKLLSNQGVYYKIKYN